ncbi:MAG: response regulator [Puniceicoccaceae bacterium]|nr:MAG: response regulator [Puniceicoccaceae bacterium]
MMNGSIGVSSEPGEGTEFRVELILPLMDGEMSPPATEVSAASGEQEPEGFGVELASILPLQIMVADDNPYIRTLVDSYLKALGYRARLVDSGAQAVANWRGVDLILMDLRMPEMDGIEAVTRIRAESGVTDEPWIIGVSATLSETEVQRAMDAGCNDFLGKPFFSKSLVEAIQASPLVVRRRRDLARGEPEVAAVSAPDLAGDTTVNGEEERAATPVDAETEKIIGKDLIYLALDEIPVLLNDMSEALDNRDYERIRETSHYLSNTVLALRMEGLLEPCREVYRLAEEEDAAALPEALTVLNSCFADWKESRNS